MRRNSDEELRDLERKAKTGDQDAAWKLFLARVRLDKVTEPFVFQIQNDKRRDRPESGLKFNVVIRQAGKIDELPDDFFVEFYDDRHKGTSRPWTTAYGQFVSDYYASTLLAGQKELEERRLDLVGYGSPWKVDAKPMAIVLDYLKQLPLARPKRKNSTDDEIRELERKETAGSITETERARLESLLARAGRARRIELAEDEIPALEDFLMRAETVHPDEPMGYEIDLANDGDGSLVDAMVRSGERTRNFGDLAGRGLDTLAVSTSRTGTNRNIETLRFDDRESVWTYVARLDALASGELEIDDGLGGMRPETDFGVWYTGEDDSGGFEIPPDLINLSDLGVTPGEGNEAGESVRVTDDLREATDLLENAQSQEDIDLAQREIDRLEAIQEAAKDYIEGKNEIREIQAERGWGARLTLPGYMDSGSWFAVYPTEQEALDELFEFEDDAISPGEQDRLRARAAAMASEILSAYGYDRET
jgi:hypothetical protein